MSIGVQFESNVNKVVSDIDDVKDDLRDDMRRKVTAAMRVLEADARTHIKQDSNWRGRLSRSLTTTVNRRPEGAEVTVKTRSGMAPYAPFVEFGTGDRTEKPWRGSSALLYSEPTSYPPDFPYSAPALSPGMIAAITEWVYTKPIFPESDSMTQKDLGFAIAESISAQGTYAHPFLRPAWFQNKLLIKRAAKNAVRSATS